MFKIIFKNTIFSLLNNSLIELFKRINILIISKSLLFKSKKLFFFNNNNSFILLSIKILKLKDEIKNKIAI